MSSTDRIGSDPDDADRIAAMLAAAEGRAQVAEAERDAVLVSTSWRITRPLRTLARLLGRGRLPTETSVMPVEPIQEERPSTTEELFPEEDPATAKAEAEMPIQRSPDGEVTLPPLSDDPLDPASFEVVPVAAEKVTDDASALIWLLEALRDPAIRKSFASDRLAAQIPLTATLAGVPEAGQAALATLLANDPVAGVRDLYLRADDLRAQYPLGLLPSVRGGFVRCLLSDPQRYGLHKEQIQLFVHWAAVNISEALDITFRFNRDWQRRFPDGLTPFGWPALKGWLLDRHGLPPGALPQAPPGDISPADAIRLAFYVRSEWQDEHPDALSTPHGTMELLRTLAVSSTLDAAARRWCNERLADGSVAAVANAGLNVIGHFRYPSGLRRSAETLCEGAEAAGLLVSRRDVRTDSADEPGREAFGGLEVHNVTLLHLQPEPFFPVAYARADLAERRPRTHRIGYWYWETETAPAHWADIADVVDEVWTATNFVGEALRRIVSVPVHVMSPGVSLPAFEMRPRSDLGLPAQDRYTFLFVFHLNSVMERKNPFGLLAAFRAAFSPNEPVDLILKVTSFGRHDTAVSLLREAAADVNVHFIDATLSTSDTLSLIAACDVYVSLHRSEGLGLTMAEAMLLGRPVLASRYSGNLDFMDDSNSILVDGALIPVGAGQPPYSPDAFWFDPSIAEAASWMRRLYENRTFAAELGDRARRDAGVRLCPVTAGHRVAARVRALTNARRFGRRPKLS